MPDLENIPRIEERHGAKQLIVDGEPMILLAGELHNSTTSSLDYARPIWRRMRAMNLNAVIAAAYWEFVEPREGEYDFSLVEGMLEEARRHGLRLVLLWFATWKNAESSYAPEWVKTDLERFARMRDADGQRLHTISPFADEACRCDARAFGRLMARLAEVDADDRTVVAVQVENEPGILGMMREHSPQATKAFKSAVPEELMRSLVARREKLPADFRTLWGESLFAETGTWAEVFGAEAGEPFMAWHIARYIDRVAEAGKAEYPLPMYANAWLPRPHDPTPGVHPSGGPVPRMLPVWQAAAPHIDFLAPDIYDEDFRGYCARYHRIGNPLFIPEARRDERSASAVFYSIAEHDAICYAPFAIDDLDPATHPLTESYGFLRDVLGLVAEHQGRGTMRGFYQQKDREAWDVAFERFGAHVEAMEPIGENGRRAGGFVIALADDEFLIAGRGLSFQFRSLDAERPECEFVWSQEGVFRDGEWHGGRRLNGDESGHGKWMNLPREVKAVRIKVHAI